MLNINRQLLQEKHQTVQLSACVVLLEYWWYSTFVTATLSITTKIDMPGNWNSSIFVIKNIGWLTCSLQVEPSNYIRIAVFALYCFEKMFVAKYNQSILKMWKLCTLTDHFIFNQGSGIERNAHYILINSVEVWVIGPLVSHLSSPVIPMATWRNCLSLKQ